MKRIRLGLIAGLVWIALAHGGQVVTNFQAVARSNLVENLTATNAVDISVVLDGSGVQYLWEIWNAGTNAIAITNGITGTNVTLEAGEFTALRSRSNEWRIIYGKGLY